MIELKPFHQAVESLRAGLARAAEVPGDEFVRDAVIQRFEYTFEMAWKMVKRRVELDSASPDQIDLFSYKNLMREAGERGLIQDVTRWLLYREQRNVTSHTYNENKAKEVFETARTFYPDVAALLQELENRNGG